MPSPSPPWKVKSRPCPFYSQGRCLFSDSCNFLHDVKAYSNPDAILVNPSHNTASVNPHTTPSQSHLSVRSPTRSPRLSQLLLALQDVIGVEEEDELPSEELTPNTGLTLVNQPHESDEPWTFVDDSAAVSPVTVESGSPVDEEDTTLDPLCDDGPVLDEDPTTRVKFPFEANNVSPHTSFRSPLEKSARTSLDLLSPIDVSHLPLIPFLRDDSATCDDSIDSGYADSWTSLHPMRLSPPRSPTRLSSTFDLLSSPFGSPSSRVLSPRLGAFLGRISGADAPASPHHGSFLSAANAEIYLPVRPDSGYDSDAQSALDDIDDSSLPETEEEETIKFVGVASGFDQDAGSAVEQSSPVRFLVSGPAEEEPAILDACPTVRKECPDVFLDPTVDSAVDPPPDHQLNLYAEHNIRSETSSSPMDASQLVPVTQDIESLPLSDNGSSPNYVDNTAALDTISPLDQSFNTQATVLDGEPVVESPIGQPLQVPAVSDPPTSPTAAGDGTLGSVYDAYSDADPTDEQLASGSMLITGTSNYEPSSRGTVSPHSSSLSFFTHGRAFTPPSSRGHTGSVSGSPLTSPLSRSSSPLGLGSPSRRSSPDHGRVFAPPAGRRRAVASSGTSAGSLRSSPASPARSNSPFQVRSPESASTKAKGKYPAQSRTKEGNGPEVAKSTKVPFGFRNSVLGRARGFSNRTSRTIPPPLTKLRIITDPTKSVSVANSPLSAEAYRSPPLSNSPTISGLKPLRLSTILSPNHYTSSSPLSHKAQPGYKRASTSSASVSSDFSISNNNLLSSARSSLIPEHIRNTLIPAQDTSLSPLLSDHLTHFPGHCPPQSAPASHSYSASLHRIAPRNQPPLDSRANRPFEPIPSDEDETDETNDSAERQHDTRYAHAAPHTAPLSRAAPSLRSPSHAIATPRPTLLFAIASDDPAQVRRVLESGDAGPNDQVGPQSALAFTLTNGRLAHRVEMVKTLLAFGADPGGLEGTDSNRSPRRLGEAGSPALSAVLEGVDPATRYYVGRANEPSTRQTSALIYRSFFRPLTRVRYEMIGQDRALEQLFRVLSVHSQQLSVTPIVVLLCGPSGHGKSLLARKFGSHLGVPTHTVNMTTLRSTHELWQSYSMSPYQESSNCTLAEFLVNNEGKRCVVVLDEIEKTADERTLWSLLMPWELGRCSVGASSRHVDVRNVIWLGTSNIGHSLVLQHHEARRDPDETMSREEYLALAGLLRPCVSERLGASLLSRVTAVLPFVPFSPDEKRAVAAEALYTLAGEAATGLSPSVVESLVLRAVSGYVPAEGARSLYRAVSSQLIDFI